MRSALCGNAAAVYTNKAYARAETCFGNVDKGMRLCPQQAPQPITPSTSSSGLCDLTNVDLRMGFSGCGEEYFATLKLGLKGMRPKGRPGMGELRSTWICIDS